MAYLENRLSQITKGQQGGDEPRNQNARQAGSNNALNEVVTIIPLGNLDAPAYVGSSSGMSLAANLQELVQSTVWNKALLTPKLRNPQEIQLGSATSEKEASGDDRPENLPGLRAITLEELVANSAKEPPSDVLGARILNTYFTQLHPRYPFLTHSEIWKLHSQRLELNSTTPSQLTKAQRFSIFKLYMVYAIGGTLLQLTEKSSNLSSEVSYDMCTGALTCFSCANYHGQSFYMTALQHISAARESRTVQNIEAMTLLVIYHLRSISSHGMWYMTGLAMRTCVDLGMHRKGHEQGLSRPVIQRRRLLFWCVYALERTIAVSLGRPASISDKQIDVELPSEFVDEGPSSPPGSNDRILLAIQLFKVRRIESRIHRSIYRVDKSLELLRPKLDRLYEELKIWWLSLPDSHELSSADMNYLQLHYNRVLRLLIQPFLSILSSSDPYYGYCLRAAGDICQVHKRLHQTPDYGHSFISVQTVFVAGITLLYGLWTQARAVWSVALADDIRACSLVLFVMGERAPWVRKFRDAFEMLVTAAMEKLQNGDSRLSEMAAAAQGQPKATNENISGNLQYGLTSSANDFTREGTVGGRGMNDQDDAWRMVVELANWIDQEEGSAIWMPDFELLQNLSGV